ncbi:neutral zinc metallopeptidase [Kribbella sp. NBC_00709]|uniref:neutral zinc metallopeptidase n=1 Tax=Kribbella sp. NBC_00709 TaxID=2975972 RepID=UPI002E2934DF|nr:neutral zinc metallopeptidase [Kribbella sp. NBC_00709]
MSQPPYGPPGQNPPYPPNQPPYQPQNQPQNPPQYQRPMYGPPPGQYGGPPPQGPGFGWGPNFGPPGPGGPGPGGPGPGWQPQRPRKKSKAPLIAILSIVGVAIVGGWIIGVVKKNADDVTTPPVSPTRYTPEPTGAPTEEPTEEPTDGPTSEPPTEEPTSTETTTAAPKVSDSAVVAKNALYKVGQMKTVNCKEPSVRPTNARNAAAYWTAIKPCLDKSWAPLVTKAGYKFKAPTMTFWAGTNATGPCGTGPVEVPYYCSANNNLYMKVDVFVKTYMEYPDAESKAYSRMWYTRSVAHEYGHGVQNMTGILQASDNIRYELTNYDDRTRQTRRMELQANCFAGVFLAVNKRSYPISGEMLYVWNKWVVTAGDKPEEGDHGSVASQQRFMGTSFKTGNPASCNTFAVSPRYVS